jgi:hypothetical protein
MIPSLGGCCTAKCSLNDTTAPHFAALALVTQWTTSFAWRTHSMNIKRPEPMPEDARRFFYGGNSVEVRALKTVGKMYIMPTIMGAEAG